MSRVRNQASHTRTVHVLYIAAVEKLRQGKARNHG